MSYDVGCIKCSDGILLAYKKNVNHFALYAFRCNCAAGYHDNRIGIPIWNDMKNHQSYRLMNKDQSLANFMSEWDKENQPELGDIPF